MAQSATANIFVSSKYANMVRNVHEIFEADSTTTYHHRMPANMNIIAEFAPAPSRNDDKWIDSHTRSERNITTVDDDRSPVDENVFAEPREADPL